MKTAMLVLAALASVVPLTWAAGVNSTLVPADTAYHVIERGANHQVWQKESYERQPNGKLVTHTHQYTELASGLNYLNNGQWVPTQEKIEVYPGGAVARQGQHQVIFANNLNSYGAIDMQTSEGQRLRSNLLGLMYYDTATGDAVLIARLQDSEGQVVTDNQVLYPNAFEGLNADVRYTYTKSGLEQDVIVKENPASPEAYGMNPETTELEVFTEFIDPPTASLRDLPGDGASLEADQEVRWGGVRLGKGKAFNLGGQDSPAAVAKRYVMIQGRHFLLEKVAVKDIQKSLSQLPDQASNTKRLPMLASKNPVLPQAPRLQAAAKPMKLAMGAMPDRGYVLDYVSLTSSQTNYTFQGDITYYISGNLNLYGTNVFEGGAVIKYAANSSLVVAAGQAVVFKAAAYLPVVFTAVDDNTIGEDFGSGSPSGYYANPALSLASLGTQCISGARFLYASQGIVAPGTALTLNNVQFVQCGVGVSASGNALTVNNGLFANVNTNFVLSGNNTTVAANQVTFNNALVLAAPAGNYPAGSSVQLTNCVLANVANVAGTVSAGYNGFYQTPMLGSPSYTNTFYPFNQVGAGAYYLTNGCAFFDAGTTNLNASLLGMLKLRTVNPPLVYSNVTISTNLTFYPQAVRDTNTPDLGYHYDPLDYVFGAVDLYSNLTFTAGTALGTFVMDSGPGYGIMIHDSNSVTFTGTAGSPCRYTRYSNVQEGAGNGVWNLKGWLAGIAGTGSGSVYPKVVANYTLCSDFCFGDGMFRDYYFQLVLQFNNCEFYSGGMEGYGLFINATNCLFKRMNLVGNGTDGACGIALRNDTFYGSVFYIQHWNGSTWPVWIENCSFDGADLTSYVDDPSGGNTNITYCNFNAYLTNGSGALVRGSNDVVVTSFNWQSSWLGNYYLPSDSQLINKGSVLASQLGLYHFTTQTNQVKETNSQVDIGYHYAAVDTNGNPMDSNGDGIPDYIQDANGNGLVDNGETPWMGRPAISSQPSSLAVVRSSNAVFTVTASGIGGLTYQWLQNGLPLTDDGSHIVGSTTTALTVKNARDTDSTFYQAVITNPAGSIYSSNATLTVLDPLVITTQPTNLTVSVQQMAVFTVVADGAVPISYQWWCNGTNVPSATNSVLSISNASTNNVGNYSVVVTNIAGSVTSSVVSLSVLVPPVSWLQQYFGANYQTNTNAIPTADPDGDGVNNLQEYYNGSNPTDYYNGVLPTLTITSGNNQSVSLGAFSGQPLQIQVTRGGTPLTNAPITFCITNGISQITTSTNGGTLTSSLSLRTDASGNAGVWLFLPTNSPTPISVIVTATSGTSSNQTVLNEYASAVATPVFSPANANFVISNGVAISCSTIGAVVHYTLNGGIPTEADPVATNGQLVVIRGQTVIKAIGFEDGVMAPSAMQTGSFKVVGAITAGAYHTLVIKYDGTLWAAGTNQYGQLGNGTTNSSSTLRQSTNIADWACVATAAGYGHSIVLANEYSWVPLEYHAFLGAVTDCGLTNRGQLGNGSASSNSWYFKGANLTNSAIAVAAGASNSLAVYVDGTVRAWGDNTYGEAGDGTSGNYRGTNVIVTNLSSVAGIAAGAFHCLALESNGTVRAWGLNSNGQLGDNTVTMRTTNVVVTNLSGVQAIAGGSAFSLALLTNGTVRAWGHNGYGQLGDGTTTERHTNVLVINLSNVVAIAAGNYHSLALLSDGTVRAWGTNNFGQLGDGATNKYRTTNVVVVGLSNIVGIAAGAGHSVALKSDGTIYVWGYTNYGRPGGYSSVPILVEPTNHTTWWTAPNIQIQPQSQTNVAGQTVIFEVGAIGATPMVYQWYLNGMAMPGGTNAYFAVTNLSATNEGSYFAVITNTMGAVTSSVVALTVVAPPFITAQPTNQAVPVGGSATFSVSVSGEVPMTYQWYGVNSGIQANATDATWTLTNVQTNNADTYYVVIANDYGSMTSSNATLYVAPVIAVQPTNQSVTLGNNVSLSVVVVGAGPFTYQWYYNSVTIGGATNSSVSIINAQYTNNGGYSVGISNAGGLITSLPAYLTVNSPLGVFAPAGLTNWWPAGNNAFDIIGGQNGAIYGNGVTYTTGKVGNAFNFSGSYGCVSLGSTAANFGTNDFTVEFWMASTAGDFGEYPILTKLPSCGATNEFTMRLEGRGFGNAKPGTLITDIGQTASTRISLQSVRTVNDGLFHHIALERQATNFLLYIDGTLETNGSTAVVVSVTNSATLLAGSSPCIGSDGVSSYFAGALDEISIYSRALQTSEIQSIYNAGSAGKITTAPYFVVAPTNQLMFVGSNATMSVVAGGNQPLVYQWYGFNAGVIAGATNATLTLGNVQTNYSDTYYVVVTNLYGSASISATLTVLDPSLYDTNGLSVAWEMYYFGHTGVDPNADPDGDGWTNLQEYQNGTNPNAADAPFNVLLTEPAKYSPIP